MSFSYDLAAGLAQLLASEGIGVWRPAGVYAESEIGITYRARPASPRRLIAISPYALSDSVSLSQSLIGVQVMCRGGDRDPRGQDDLADAVFDLLHGMQQARLATGVLVTHSRRVSSLSLGQEPANGLWARSDNYYFDVHYPTRRRS